VKELSRPAFTRAQQSPRRFTARICAMIAARKIREEFGDREEDELPGKLRGEKCVSDYHPYALANAP